MLIKTILNKAHEFKSFVYQDVNPGFYQGSEVFNVTVVPRKNIHALCSGCQKPVAGYDQDASSLHLFGESGFSCFTECVERDAKSVALKLNRFPGLTVRENSPKSTCCFWRTEPENYPGGTLPVPLISRGKKSFMPANS